MATEMAGKSEGITENPTQNKTTTMENPFQMADDNTDVAFVVEGEKLHLNRTELSRVSPVFKAMLTSDFKEKNAKTIPLPGKTLQDMVPFLEQIHPAHSAKSITDETMPVILRLADEYQVETVYQKCIQHIETQLQRPVLTNDQVLIYLWMCERYSDRLKEHRERLMTLATARNCTELQKSEVFQSIPQSVSFELLSRRNATLEEGYSRIYDLIRSLPLDCKCPVNSGRYSRRNCPYCVLKQSKRIIEKARDQKHN